MDKNCKTDAALWISIVDLVAIVGGGAYIVNTFNNLKIDTDKNIKEVTTKIDKTTSAIKNYIIPEISSAKEKIDSQQNEINQLKSEVYELNRKMGAVSENFTAINNAIVKLNNKINSDKPGSSTNICQTIPNTLPQLPMQFKNQNTYAYHNTQSFPPSFHPDFQNDTGPQYRVHQEPLELNDNDDDINAAFEELQN